MVSTHPGDHNNEKIKIGQTSQFSAICFFVISYDEFECIMSNIECPSGFEIMTVMLEILLFLHHFLKAPSSQINRR